MGFTKKELKSLATIKCKNFYLGDITNPESITRLNENGSTHDETQTD
jgi:hypothetical protein